MQRHRMRPQEIDATQFDGTAAGVERVVAWAAAVAPWIPIRPRTEYRGWDDLTGWLELEVQGFDHGYMGGDWIVVSTVEERSTPWFIDDQTFRKYSESVIAADA